MRKACFFILFITLVLFPFGGITFAHSEDKPRVMSETAILIDAASGQVLFEKDAKKKMYPASLTKILTGIVAIEEGHLTEVATVSEKAAEVDGTSVFLVEDEKIELKRLVEGLLINSGNDAGAVIAEHLAGSEAGFSQIMNEFARTKIGVEDSHFTNPHGLFDEDHYTTAYDMAKIAQYAMRNETFKEIVSTEELEWKGEQWKTTLYNHHQMLRDNEEVTGIKNGFVQQSGFTLATSAERESMEVIAVTLNATTSRQAYEDTEQLLNYGFENFSTEKVEKSEIFTNEVGKPYTLKSDIYITAPKEENVTKEIIGESLVIKDKEGKVLSKKEVVPVEEKTKGIETDISKEEKEHWLAEMLRRIAHAFQKTTKNLFA